MSSGKQGWRDVIDKARQRTISRCPLNYCERELLAELERRLDFLSRKIAELKAGGCNHPEAMMREACALRWAVRRIDGFNVYERGPENGQEVARG